MNYDLIINVKPNEVNMALLADKRLIELHAEPKQAVQDATVGDLFLGRVKKILPELNAVFVDIGTDKDAFLHYFDLGPRLNTSQQFLKKILEGHSASVEKTEILPEIDKKGSIKDVLNVNDFVLAQMIKEPISSKGSRLSCELTLPGRYLVVLPFSNQISVSQKIENEQERKRLKDIVRGIKPKNFGVIIRTVAENVSAQELENDLKQLLIKYKETLNALKEQKKPRKILAELSRFQMFLRDSLNENFNAIYVDHPDFLEQVKNYVREIAPDKLKIVQRYEGKEDILEHFNVHRQAKILFGKQIPLKSGAYLIVEHTEALHVIDVNTGGKKFRSVDDDLILQTNLDAAKEIARLLRLRDIGGIIVIDFIDMHNQEKNKILHQYLRDCMKTDKAQHKILPPSHFSLVEITRERVRPPLVMETKEVCYACKGTGKSVSSLVIADEIEGKIHWYMKNQPQSLTLIAHPFVAAFFNQGFWSKKRQWIWKYKKNIQIRSNASFSLGVFQILNHKGEQIN